MANVIITLTIMPDSPETDLNKIEEKVKEEIKAFCGEGETKTEIKEVAFGLKSINITFVTDENKGTTDPLEEKISKIEGINSVEVTDVRRALG